MKNRPRVWSAESVALKSAAKLVLATPKVFANPDSVGIVGLSLSKIGLGVAQNPALETLCAEFARRRKVGRAPVWPVEASKRWRFFSCGSGFVSVGMLCARLL